MKPEFKKKLVKGVVIGAGGIALTLAAAKGIEHTYDKVVIENWAAKSVLNYLDRTMSNYDLKLR